MIFTRMEIISILKGIIIIRSGRLCLKKYYLEKGRNLMNEIEWKRGRNLISEM